MNEHDESQAIIQPIETRVVYGFLDAGKTSYIRDCIMNDYFYKYGTTLILCFEQGEEEYDSDVLASRRTSVSYYEDGLDVGVFCRRSIEAARPDRIYVEMNAMMQGLREQFPECMKVAFSVTWLDWATLPVYWANFKQLISQMVTASQQIVFRGCPDKELLVPYSQPFRLLNQKASYLRQDPMGYHERAFDRFLPFSLECDEIAITEENYLPFWLDALEHPEHYEGKTLHFRDPLELRRSVPMATEPAATEPATTESASIEPAVAPWFAGRVVMVCCMADLQFMSFEVEVGNSAGELAGGGWIVFDALAVVGRDEYGQKRLKLIPSHVCHTSSPNNLILNG